MLDDSSLIRTTWKIAVSPFSFSIGMSKLRWVSMIQLSWPSTVAAWLRTSLRCTSASL